MNRNWILVKDVAFIAIGVLLMVRTGFFGILIGGLAVIWYGRDLYFRLAALKAAKAQEKAAQRPSQPSPEEGKIRITDLSDAKEVDFEKE